jgi:hypothetical protein
MHSVRDPRFLTSAIPLRAIIEIVNGELRILPIAESDADEQQILYALRFLREDFRR